MSCARTSPQPSMGRRCSCYGRRLRDHAVGQHRSGIEERPTHDDTEHQRGTHAGAGAVRRAASITGSSRDPARITQMLERAAEIAHVLTPASSCPELPEGISITTSAVLVHPSELYAIPASGLRASTLEATRTQGADRDVWEAAPHPETGARTRGVSDERRDPRRAPGPAAMRGVRHDATRAGPPRRLHEAPRRPVALFQAPSRASRSSRDRGVMASSRTGMLARSVMASTSRQR
jgi:hypothetical protein